ncbi:MAG: helix-turn-helix transcriptional regulator [Bacteroidales bacterium]|nr:helix-turn-helix transcriptional regulator [Bacteroidales bacterium]
MFVEQIPVEYTLCFVFYGGTALMALIACIYLCLRRGNAFAADVTPPMQLRRWAAAFFALAFLSHVWWLLFYIYSNNFNSVACLVVAVIDYLGLLVSIAGTLFAMLQDRKRPIWPMVVAMIPYAVLLTMNVVFPDHHFLYIAIAYLMMVFVLFSVYMVYAVRQYRNWLRDNYADLEHKEVWASHVLIIAILLLFTFGEVEGISLTISFLVQFLELPLFWFLLWRVETMPQLQVVAVEQEPIERAQQPQQPQQSLVIPSNIEQLLEEHCVAAQLYLQHDLTLIQLAQTIGTNRFYLSQYFSRQGITYNAYINDLRINHFMSLYQEAAAAQKPISAQQLASESGYRSYSTFSLAFKQRTGQSVTAWMRNPQCHLGSQNLQK